MPEPRTPAMNILYPFPKGVLLSATGMNLAMVASSRGSSWIVSVFAIEENCFRSQNLPAVSPAAQSIRPIYREDFYFALAKLSPASFFIFLLSRAVERPEPFMNPGD